MSDNVTYIPNRLKNAAKGGFVTGASDIIDDAKNKDQQTVNQETSQHLATHDTEIQDRYTKEEVNNIVSRTPETDVIVIDIPSEYQSDIAGWLDANTPSGTDPETGRSVRANKLYRVPGPDNTTYSEWAWDGAAYIMLANKDYGIDEEPTAGSNNLVKSGGVAQGIQSLKKPNLYLGRIECTLVGILSTNGNLVTNEYYRTSEKITIPESCKTLKYYGMTSDTGWVGTFSTLVIYDKSGSVIYYKTNTYSGTVDLTQLSSPAYFRISKDINQSQPAIVLECDDTLDYINKKINDCYSNFLTETRHCGSEVLTVNGYALRVNNTTAQVEYFNLSDYIEIDCNSRIQASGLFDSAPQWAGLMLYDENKNPITYWAGSADFYAKEFSGAKYVRVCVEDASLSSFHLDISNIIINGNEISDSQIVELNNNQKRVYVQRGSEVVISNFGTWFFKDKVKIKKGDVLSFDIKEYSLVDGSFMSISLFWKNNGTQYLGTSVIKGNSRNTESFVATQDIEAEGLIINVDTPNANDSISAVFYMPETRLLPETVIDRNSIVPVVSSIQSRYIVNDVELYSGDTIQMVFHSLSTSARFSILGLRCRKKSDNTQFFVQKLFDNETITSDRIYYLQIPFDCYVDRILWNSNDAQSTFNIDAVVFMPGAVSPKQGETSITYITVQRNNADYNSIRETINSITDASELNQYVVVVPNGRWFECDIQGKKWVTLHGESKENTIIYCDGSDSTKKTPVNYSYPDKADQYLSDVSWDFKHVVFLKDDFKIENLTIEGDNVKYCIHGDYHGIPTWNECIVRDCIFNAIYTQHVLGFGVTDTETFIAERCKFKTGASAIDTCCAVYVHNWSKNDNRLPLYAGGAKVIIKDSYIDTEKLFYIGELGSLNNDLLAFENCQCLNLHGYVRVEKRPDGSTYYIKDDHTYETNPLLVPYCMHLNMIKSGVPTITYPEIFPGYGNTRPDFEDYIMIVE